MPIVVNSNPSATTASNNLSKANDALRKSLARLSSGKRIVSPADDAGGLAVAYKLESRLNRIEALKQNVQNGISYLQVQDGALSAIGDVLTRMSELRTMAQDVSKNEQDVENYTKEFIELQRQISQVYREKFNGVSLFAVSSAPAVLNPPDLRPQLSKEVDGGVAENGQTYNKFSRILYTHDSGQAEDGNVSIGVANMQFILSMGGLDTRYVSAAAAVSIAAVASNDPAMNLGNLNSINSDDFQSQITRNEIYTSDGFLKSIMFVSVGQFTTAIERLADARAENGAEQSRLNMSLNLLNLNMANLEAAHGRIMDADIALESTRFARQNVLVQSSAAMVAQANQLTQVALTMIGG